MLFTPLRLLGPPPLVSPSSSHPLLSFRALPLPPSCHPPYLSAFLSLTPTLFAAEGPALLLPFCTMARVDASSGMPEDEGFQDFLPIMAEKLGGDELMAELCGGFRLLADESTGTITFESLKKNAAFLGLENMSDDELRAMIVEGDFDGDGVLNQQEFCVLMVRMSPSIMAEAEEWLAEKLKDCMDCDLLNSSEPTSVLGL